MALKVRFVKSESLRWPKVSDLKFMYIYNLHLNHHILNATLNSAYSSPVFLNNLSGLQL